MLHQITIANHALEEMVLAASESFVLGNAKRFGSVEIQGYLWGNRRIESDDEDESVEYIHVDKFSVSTSASGDDESVYVDQEVVLIKNSIVTLWAPHYQFLGAFHTHPYDTLGEVNSSSGWNFSSADEENFLDDADMWELSGTDHHPIMMVMAVTKIAAVFDTELKVTNGGRSLEFNVGNLRFWLSVGIGQVSRGMDKEFSTGNVRFHPFTRYFNAAGSRLDGIYD